ncbi:MAG: PadR family transcriptional regulator [Candidatus Hodarchaeota archaeon]
MIFPSGFNLKSPIELLILLTIGREEGIHGFDLIKKLDHFENWEPKAGTVYPILERLTTRGFLEKVETSKEAIRKKAGYRLTSEGKEELKKVLEIFEISMNNFEKFMEIGSYLIKDDSKFIDFFNNRIKKFLDLIKKKKFEPSPEVLSHLQELTDFLVHFQQKFDEKISDLKKEGKFVKIKIE